MLSGPSDRAIADSRFDYGVVEAITIVKPGSKRKRSSALT
jgi:hypothetical protein